MNIATATRMDLTDKEVTITDFKRLKRNIDGALKIQSERYGNKDAEWIRKHL